MLSDLLQSKFKEARFLEGDRHSGHEVKVIASNYKCGTESSCIVRY